MKLISFKELQPTVSNSAIIFDHACIVGDVTLEDHVTVWFNATIRGDMAPVIIKQNTNIQDNCVIHTNHNLPTHIGRDCTVGHGAIIHAATISDYCLIGMGSIILDGALIQEHSLVAAGSVVPPNKTYPPKSLILGNPAKAIRELKDEEIEGIQKNTDYYVSLGAQY